MKRTLLSAALAAAFVLGAGSVQAASFSYHGSLQDSGEPAEGSYDIELTLYSAPSGGSVIGGPLVMFKVPVHGGSFNTEADFGPLSQSFSQAYVGVKVRNEGNGEFATLSARAPMSVAATTSVCPGAWTLGGNAGNPGGSYLGTADGQPVTFKVNGAFAGQITPSGDPGTTSTPNVAFGSGENTVLGSSGGATIAGGGDPNYGFNSVQGDFATVGGGVGNTAGQEATVGGGAGNTAGQEATVGGGAGNTAGLQATVGGGTGNTASGETSFVGGGLVNMATGSQSTVVGGAHNTASGVNATVTGGEENVAGGDNSFAGGFFATVRDAATVGGGNTTGDHGTFVWSDDSAAFTSTGPRQFLIQSVGGVGINTNAPFANTLTVAGSGGPISFTPTSHTAAVFENNGIAFVEAASPAANENGVLFSLVGHSADGGIVYNDVGGGYSRGLELRTGGNVTRVAITSAGETLNTSGAWSMFSDIRLKHDIAPIDHPLDTFLGLHGQTFEYIDPVESMATPGRRMGFIAQDVEQVLPQWISEDARGYKMVTPTGFEALTVEAMRALRDEKDGEISALKAEKDAEIAGLRAQLDSVLTRVSKLEAKEGE